MNIRKISKYKSDYFKLLETHKNLQQYTINDEYFCPNDSDSLNSITLRILLEEALAFEAPFTKLKLMETASSPFPFPFHPFINHYWHSYLFERLFGARVRREIYKGFKADPIPLFYYNEKALFDLRIICFLIKNYSENKTKSIILEYILTFKNDKENNTVILKLLEEAKFIEKNDERFIKDEPTTYLMIEKALIRFIMNRVINVGDPLENGQYDFNSLLCKSELNLKLTEDYNTKYEPLVNEIQRKLLIEDHFFKFLEKISAYNYILKNHVNETNIHDFYYIFNKKLYIHDYVKTFSVEYPTEKAKIKQLHNEEKVYLKKLKELKHLISTKKKK